jgi:glycosyltransferase involved in cell wall biosynthesis
VDNNSTDNTKEIAHKYTDKVYNKGPERSPQRNYGVSVASGDYVAIIDSDMELSPKVIEECVHAINKEGVVGVIIPEESFGIGFWAQCKKLERSFYVGVSWMEAARFFKRKTFLSIGGYNESIVSGEDWDLSQRFNVLGQLKNINKFIRHNEGHLRLYSTIKKKYYYAKKFNIYQLTTTSNNLRSQSSAFARFNLYFSQPSKLFSKPLVGLGMLFVKSLEMLSYGFVKIIK